MAKRPSEGPASSPEIEHPITQRAYTLRLRATTDEKDDREAGDRKRRELNNALWATHAAINNGARAFGDWLLTLRGGLSHELAEPPQPPKMSPQSDDEAAALQKKHRRILLALSWLSVEDARGAPDGVVRIASGQEADSVRSDKVLAALRSVLTGRGIDSRTIESWVADCSDSLSARIRDDAVWVNRSAMFDTKARNLKGLTHAYAADTVLWFFGPADEYFSLPDADAEGGPAAFAGEDDSKFKQKAREWISTNFGTGSKNDTQQIITHLRELAAAALHQFEHRPKDALIEAMATMVNGPTRDLNGLRVGIGWRTGRSSKGNLAVQRLPDRLTRADIEAMQRKFAEEADEKDAKSGARNVPKWMPEFQASLEAAVGMPFVGGRDYTSEYSVMLDHASRRVSIGHSWIKRAETERRRFESDALRAGQIPAEATAWLDRYVQDRSGSAGGEYRVRRRAIEGWEEVLKQWSQATCRSSEDRVAAARDVQADPDIDKFGDIQLFETLASDDATCVWRFKNETTPGILKDYVFAHDARFKQRRFKVPAYRHPDALRHPVFGDFGNSRWKVEYAALEAAKAGRGDRRIDARDADWLKNPRALRMGLWDGSAVNDFDLRWSCKRLAADLSLGQTAHNGPVRSVSRADRLGRAAAGMKPGESPSAAGLFSQAEWNARLQAPRSQLNDLAEYLDRNDGRWDGRAQQMLEGIRWLASFSARLECQGPFIEYVKKVAVDAPARPFVSRQGELAVRHETNRSRSGPAKLLLSRLAGLRVLSVDLGHRFAAACAVWETMPRSALMQEIADRAVIEGGAGGQDLYLHTRHKDGAGRERITIYRRIGGDNLPDGSVHPAPWARLDRQFLIKLQGEESSARKASPAEFGAVVQLESELGCVRTTEHPLPKQIDELLGEAVRSIRLGLRRHGDSARIAYAFHPESARLMSGGRSEPHTTESRRQAILDALMRWHGLMSGDRWSDPWAAKAWQDHVQPELESDLPAPSPDAERWDRKRFRVALEEALSPVATTMSQGGATALHTLWAERWRTDDEAWRPRLRQLRRLLMPRGLRPVNGEADAQAALRKARRAAARHVGGLSLTRIATLRELYQLQKAYAMRPEPDNPRKNVPDRNDDRLVEFGRSVLESVDRLREQRVKQIASRVAEAALGVGRASRTGDRDRKRPSSQVDAPCHAIVIESLRNYRPDELRTRRENRGLMNWSAGKVRKCLEEACQLHGLHLREVTPNYTSRQCSRTGLPGMRCDDVPVSEFLTAPWWNKAVTAAGARLQKNGADSLDQMLVALREKWSSASEQDQRGQRTIRLPRAGGDLFVAAAPHRHTDSATFRAVQSDLNAAANIGLRALLDPDFPGKWWYVPCVENKGEGTAIPRTDRVKGSACFGPDPSKPERFGSLLLPKAAASPSKPKRARRGSRGTRPEAGTTINYWSDVAQPEIEAAPGPEAGTKINYWSDPRGVGLRNAADGGFWLPTPAYWRWVRKRVVVALRQGNGLPARPGDLVPDSPS